MIPNAPMGKITPTYNSFGPAAPMEDQKAEVKGAARNGNANGTSKRMPSASKIWISRRIFSSAERQRATPAAGATRASLELPSGVFI
jgi:hypothetical protein